jgi:hypothetical protein
LAGCALPGPGGEVFAQARPNKPGRNELRVASLPWLASFFLNISLGNFFIFSSYYIQVGDVVEVVENRPAVFRRHQRSPGACSRVSCEPVTLLCCDQRRKHLLCVNIFVWLKLLKSLCRHY